MKIKYDSKKTKIEPNLIRFNGVEYGYESTIELWVATDNPTISFKKSKREVLNSVNCSILSIIFDGQEICLEDRFKDPLGSIRPISKFVYHDDNLISIDGNPWSSVSEIIKKATPQFKSGDDVKTKSVVKESLYRVTMKGFNAFGSDSKYKTSYVVAKDPNEAYTKLLELMRKKSIGYASDRILQSVELIADETSDSGTMLCL